MDNKSQSSF
jgi:hypothetical protein